MNNLREDQRFEIERAFDLIPHVVGASWAVLWFRLSEIKNPTRQEFRDKVIEFLNLLKPLFESYPSSDKFTDITKYIHFRENEEIEKIRQGNNAEIEKRYDRYVDYG